MKLITLKPLLLLIIILAIFFTGCTQKKQKPNIIFIFADDQCYNTINALGNKEVITPNIDKLVMNGVTFTHTYNMGGWNGAVCIASRTMMNTVHYLYDREVAHQN